MVEKSLNAVIVGGSLTGLFQGVVLKKLGCNVRILERAGPDDLREQGAGITAGEEVQNFFNKYDRFSDQPYSVLVDQKLQFIDQSGQVSKTGNIPLRMTSWNTLYYRLRANFDGLQSDYVAIDRHTPETAAGAASYEFGCNVTDVKYNMGTVEVNFERLTGGGETLHADLVIAADGPASGIRRMLCPGTERNYVGYVAWRGTVVESQISDETKALFRTCLSYFIYPGGHILIYLIPGKNGSLKSGERLLNYVWYCNYAANSPELRNLMTDTEGHYHRITMPMGKIRPEVCARQMAYADRILPTAFAEVVQSNKQPFVQCITDPSAPQAVFFGGHLLLAGDALCNFRPHAGASTNQAALHALLLGRTFPFNITQSKPLNTTSQVSSKSDRLTIQAYESKVLRYAKLTSLMSVAWGNKNQFSIWIFLGSVFWLALAYVEVSAGALWKWLTVRSNTAMSKKPFKSQASSSRAISGAFGAPDGALGALGAGFGAVPSSPLSYVYEPPDLSNISDPNAVVAFKNLQKKDSTTKAKALEDLQKHVSALAPKDGLEEAVLESWIKVYPRTSIDTARRVRQLAHLLQSAIVRASGKRFARCMPDIAGPWLAGMFDGDKAVNNAATESLKQVFQTEEKLKNVWKLYLGSILQYCSDAIFKETTNTLSDERIVSPDDAFAKHARVVASAVHVMRYAIGNPPGTVWHASLTMKADRWVDNTPDNALEKHEDTLKHILSRTELWKFSFHSDSAVRRAVYKLLDSSLAQRPGFMDFDTISSCVLVSSLSISQTSSAVAYSRALAHLTRHNPTVWTEHYKSAGKKTAHKRLIQFLANGSQGGSSEYWEEVNTLLSNIPQTVLLPPEDVTDHNFAVLEALRDGISNREEPRTNQAAAWNAYLNLVARFQSFPNVDRDGLIDGTVMPMLVEYITPSRKTSSWSMSASQELILPAAIRLAIASQEHFIKQWRDLSQALIQDMQASLPEQSKDFEKSQDAIVTKARRWFDLQVALRKVEAPEDIRTAVIDATAREVQSIIALLKARNGKPHGAAFHMVCAVRSTEDVLASRDDVRSLVTDFVATHVPDLLLSPSAPNLIQLLSLLGGITDIGPLYRTNLRAVLQAPDGTAKQRALQGLVLYPFLAHVSRDQELLEWLAATLQPAVENDTAQDAILKTIMANPDAPSQLTQNLLGRMISNLTIDGHQLASLRALETVAKHSPEVVKEYDASTEDSVLLTKLMLLTESPELATHQRARNVSQIIQTISSADPAQAYQKRIRIIRQNLDTVEEDTLPMVPLMDITQQVMKQYDHERDRISLADELLPDESRWNKALYPLYAAKPNPSLATVNAGGTAVSLVESPGLSTPIPYDNEGLSAAFRMFWFTYNLIGLGILEHATEERRSCIYRYLAIVSRLAGDRMGIESSHLWKEQIVEHQVLLVTTEVQKLLHTWYREGPSNISVFNALAKLLEGSRGLTARTYYSSLAFGAMADEVTEGRSKLDAIVGADALKSIKDSPDVFAGIATVLAIGDLNALKRVFNELLSTLTGCDLRRHAHGLTNMIILNTILTTEDFADVLPTIPKQRLVFFVQHAAGQLVVLHRSSGSDGPTTSKDLNLEAEIMRALTSVLRVLSETYGSFWDEILQIIEETWSRKMELSDETLPLIHASLRLYSSFLRCGSGHSNDDLSDAIDSHRKTISLGMINLLHELSRLPDKEHKPRMLINELLARLIARGERPVTLESPSELFPILASESISLQGAAYEILHLGIPKEQESVSLEKALSKDYVAKLPEELLSLALEAPTLESLEDVSFKRSIPSSLRTYLLTWHLIFGHWTGASDAVKADYVGAIKEGSYLNGLLNFASEFLITSRPRPIDASKFELDTYRPDEEMPEKDAQWFLIHLYYLALKFLPTLAKAWWRDNTSRQTQTSVESWTEKHISPHIIASELHAVSAWAASRDTDPDQSMTIKTSAPTREITASIPIDEQAMSIAIALPPSYPLSRATVSGLHRVGVTEQKWRGWIITTQGVINFSDIGGGGQSLIDGLTAWRKNVTATLKGQAECAICYSVISADRQLPSKRCGTCKNLFHGSCLYKWFKSSNSSGCPLCRNQFSYA
ncbi:MAG: hypothetical protein Q9177_002214 [Variospora cf. flavescens]